MASRSNPASAVVTYFETVPIETATVVLAIVKGIVKRRAGPTGRVRTTSAKTKLTRVATPARVEADA